MTRFLYILVLLSGCSFDISDLQGFDGDIPMNDADMMSDGFMPDGMTPDAGTPDSGEDADTPDSGLPDSVDAGMPDSGPDVDAGIECRGGEVLCEGTYCADLQNSVDNCGTCDNFCTGSFTCERGSCVLPDAGMPDPDAGMPDPDAGMPDAGTCPSGMSRCGGVCVDTTNDVNHCGGCGSVCDSNRTDSCNGSYCRCGSSPECNIPGFCLIGSCTL